MRIAVVEDEARTRRGIIELIRKINSDYQIVGEAENGRTGMNIIAEVKPDLVIVDIKMPEMDGIEMLQQLKELGIKHKTIILSGYSDFEYAQKAIKIGVSEYLLKPITAEDIKNTLKNIEKEIESERKVEQGQSYNFNSLEYIFQSLIIGNSNDSEVLLEHLKGKSDIELEGNFIAVTVYLGESINHFKDRIKELLASLLNRFQGLRYHIIEMDIHKELVVIMQDNKNIDELEKYFQNTILRAIHDEGIQNAIIGWFPFKDLQYLKNSLQILRQELKWSIVLGDDVLVSYPKTQKIYTKPVQYPIDIENQAKTATYAGDINKLHNSMEDFLSLWRKDLYQPSDVIEAFVRFASSIINVVKEINEDLYKIINQKETLQKILDSMSWHEIRNTLVEIAVKISTYDETDDQVRNLIVKKAIKIITDNYSKVITLEKTAAKLHITPGYLSSLFYKETGKNFTLYIKELRINKAKELLVNTPLKSYVVAEKVGYPDPKYFSRVFKEITGFSPADYQKTYKV